MRKISALLLVSIMLLACNKSLWQAADGNGSNIYMLGRKPAPDNNYYAVDPIMRISRVEPAGDSVRLYTHILDADNTFITGAANPANRRLWCTLTVNGTPVSNYNVREVVENSNVPTVYALVLDHSGSMSGKVTKMQQAVRDFISKKKPNDAICIVKYDNRAVIEVPENVNGASIQQQFNSNGLAGFGGSTAILNGIMMGMEHIRSSPYRRKVVISFTDGADNASTITKEYVTWYAQQNNINLCTIDFNNSLYNDFMPELANNTGGTYTYFNQSNDFNNVFDDVVNKMNHSYIVSYRRITPGDQQVVLRYCAEPVALEARADFNTIRSNIEPVRNAPPRPSNNNATASADRPIYNRPVSNYPVSNTPVRGNAPVTRTPIKPSNGSTTAPDKQSGTDTKDVVIPTKGGSSSNPSNGKDVNGSTKEVTTPTKGGSSSNPSNGKDVNGSTKEVTTPTKGGSSSNPSNGKDVNGSTKEVTTPTKGGSSSNPSNGKDVNGSTKEVTTPTKGGSSSSSGTKDTDTNTKDTTPQGKGGSSSSSSGGKGSGSSSTASPTKPVNSSAPSTKTSGSTKTPVTNKTGSGSGKPTDTNTKGTPTDKRDFPKPVRP